MGYARRTIHMTKAKKDVPTERVGKVLNQAELTSQRGITTTRLSTYANNSSGTLSPLGRFAWDGTRTEEGTDVYIEIRGLTAEADEEKQGTDGDQKLLPLEGERKERMRKEVMEALTAGGYKIAAETTYTVEYLVLRLDPGAGFEKKQAEFEAQKQKAQSDVYWEAENNRREAERARDPWKYDRDNDPTR